MNVVLLEPEIPANTGNIGRTCVATGTRLHLIEPLGFRLGEKEIRRAGMDYWKDLDVTLYLDYGDFQEKNPGARIYYASTKAPQMHHAALYIQVIQSEQAFCEFFQAVCLIEDDLDVSVLVVGADRSVHDGLQVSFDGSER